jgi:hypothetical protein
MVENGEARGRENPWLHVGIIQRTHQVGFIPKNFNYISRCKLRDLVNATNDKLCQYVRAYSELMLEI